MQHKLNVEPTGGFACPRIRGYLEQHTSLLDSIPQFTKGFDEKVTERTTVSVVYSRSPRLTELSFTVEQKWNMESNTRVRYNYQRSLYISHLIFFVSISFGENWLLKWITKGSAHPVKFSSQSRNSTSISGKQELLICKYIACVRTPSWCDMSFQF